MLDSTSAVANRLRPHSCAIQHREIEIGHRGTLWEDDVAARLDSAVAMSSEDDGQVGMDVLVPVAEAAAVNDQ